MPDAPAPASWRLIVTPPAPADWNMACDEAFGDAVRAGRSDPVLRFFRWDPPAISFGYGQHVDREVDISAARARGIGIVRRVTGGRAVLHADEITYSVICREDDPVASGGIGATYARISEGLAAGLRLLGIPAELSHTVESLLPRAVEATLPCFGSTARAELVVGGRKIVGSAQHRMRGLMIQHGSVLAGPRHREIVDFLRAAPEVRERYADRLAESTTSLAEEGFRGGPDEVADALAQGFASHLGVILRKSALEDSECAEARRLAGEKYGADWWNFRLRDTGETGHGAVD